MIGEIIFEKVEDKIIITKHNSAIPEAYELIENLVWGSSGPRFYKINTHVKIDNSVNPDFLYLWKNGDFAGMCTISHRAVCLASEWLPSYYLQFFSMNPKFQGQGLGNILVESVRDHYQNISSHSVVSYAYIEGENVRSDKVAHFIKYKQAAKFKTILFGRMFP
ncbi:MAG: GNAT family N-acetyltransferase, partial [Schleiferiaceae bacterium]|nr:GNAT family N-acetyltransferase [Schleiferiaceae bacterium]